MKQLRFLLTKYVFYGAMVGAVFNSCAATKGSATGEERGEVVELTRPIFTTRLDEITGERPIRMGGICFDREYGTNNSGGPVVVFNNYGYGSAGWTLAPGGAEYCLKLLHEHEEIHGRIGGDKSRVAVIGAGIAGLTMADMLLRDGYPVSLYAQHRSPNTTSDKAAGLWAAAEHERGALPLAIFRQLERVSYGRYYEAMRAGYPFIHMRPIYAFSNGTYLRTLCDVIPLDLKTVTVRFIGGDEGVKAVSHTALAAHLLQIDTTSYLQHLLREIARNGEGGKVQMHFDHIFYNRNDIRKLSEPIVFNCSGDGLGDMAVRKEPGRLVLLPTQLGVNYMATRAIVKGGVNGHPTMMVARGNDIVIGASSDLVTTYDDLVHDAWRFFYDSSALLDDEVPVDSSQL